MSVNHGLSERCRRFCAFICERRFEFRIAALAERLRRTFQVRVRKSKGSSPLGGNIRFFSGTSDFATCYARHQRDSNSCYLMYRLISESSVLTARLWRQCSLAKIRATGITKWGRALFHTIVQRRTDQQASALLTIGQILLIGSNPYPRGKARDEGT